MRYLSPEQPQAGQVFGHGFSSGFSYQKAPVSRRLSPDESACVAFALRRRFVGKSQEYESDREEDCKACDGDVDCSARQFDSRNHHGADEACALCEDIIDAKVLTRVFGRNDLGKITARKRLNGALEAADAEGKDAKLDQCFQCQGIQADHEITDDAYKNQCDSVIFFGQPCEYK